MNSNQRFVSVAVWLCLAALVSTAVSFSRNFPQRRMLQANVNDWGHWPWLREPPLDSQIRSTLRPPEKTTRNSLAELRENFDEFDGFDPRHQRWIKIESGPVGWNFGQEGWLLEVTAKEIRLLSPNAVIETFRRPEGERLRFPPGEWVDVSETQSQNDMAWRVSPGSFRKYCETFLTEAKHAEPAEDSFAAADIFASVHARFSLFARIVDASRFAVWAARLGDGELADSLVDEAKQSLTQCEPFGHPATNDKDRDLRNFVLARLVEGCRSAAVSRAHVTLESRTKLLQFWRQASRLPDTTFQEESQRMIENYESLLADDAEWTEPSEAEFEQFSEESTVRYWLHHLRDTNVAQNSDPGACLVTWPKTLPYYWSPGSDTLPGLRDPQTKQRRNPAYELVQLGQVALPLVREHLGDSRPTRCEEHWRSYWPDGRKLVSYGQCCRQIAEAIERHTDLKSN